MRKDLRIGLGIGGVLLAVLIVALIVRKDQTPTPGDPNPQANANPQPGAPAADPAADPFRPAPPGRTATSDDWATLLATGEINSISTTPGMPPAATPPTPTPPAPGPIDPLTGVAVAPPLLQPRTPGDGLFAPPLPPTESVGPSVRSGARSHVIREGETFSSIANDHYGESRYYLAIIKANPSINPNRLRPGQTINLPDLASIGSGNSNGSGGSAAGTTPGGFRSARTERAVDGITEYRVQSGDSLYRISMRLYGTPNKVDLIYETNRATIGPDRERLKIGQVLRLPEPPTMASGR